MGGGDGGYGRRGAGGGEGEELEQEADAEEDECAAADDANGGGTEEGGNVDGDGAEGFLHTGDGDGMLPPDGCSPVACDGSSCKTALPKG